VIYLARCPICKTEQYGYNWTATPKGKKWLKNSEGRWHDCPKTTSKYQSKPTSSITRLVFNDYEFCELCGVLVYKKETLEKHKQLSGTDLTEHLNIFHPNNEILDNIDFMVISDEDKEKVRVDWDMPKTDKKYVSKNKFVSRVE
tara:strand:- start:295 stop:726 length:432 start_codon:yes stop_codon:yes gene_type:complete